MPTLSMNQAAKMFRISRNTLKSKLEQGELSYAQSGTGIDLSELIRVFGAAPDHALTDQHGASQSNPSEQARATLEQAQIVENKARIASLEMEVRMLRERLDECQSREAWMREQVERTQRLLEYKPEQPTKKTWRLW